MKLNFKEAYDFLEFDNPPWERKFKTIYGTGIDLVYILTGLKQIMLKYIGEHDMEFEYREYLIHLYPYPKDGMEVEDLIRLAELRFILDDEHETIAMLT